MFSLASALMVFSKTSALTVFLRRPRWRLALGCRRFGVKKLIWTHVVTNVLLTCTFPKPYLLEYDAEPPEEF